MARESFWSGLVVMAAALAALYWIIPAYAGLGGRRGMPPDLLPRIAAFLMLFGGLGVVATATLRAVRLREPLFPQGVPLRAIWMSGWPFLYVAAAIVVMNFVKITHIGAPMIALFLLLLGERRPWLILLAAVGPVALLYVLSVHLMRVGVV